MTTTSKILAFTSASLKTGVGSLVVLGLVGCDGLARFAAKPDTPPTEPLVAEGSLAAASPPEQQVSVDTQAKPEKKLASPLYEWKGNGRSITRIVVNTNDQKARFYSGDEEVGWSTVATGLPKYPTPTGRFQVTEKVENKRSNLYGKVYGKGGRVLRSSVKVGRDPIPDGGRFEGAHMPFFMRLTDDGVGLHAGPIPNPGQPASHGCIRMPSKIAPVVFRHVSNGTSVTIEGKGPSYGDYVAKQRANAARRAEERRIAEQRAAEAKKAQQVAQATPSAPDATSKPRRRSAPRHLNPVLWPRTTPCRPLRHSIPRMRARHGCASRPLSPRPRPGKADAPATPPAAEIVPAPEAAKPAPTEPQQPPSIIEDAPQTAPAPADGLPSSIREGTIELGPQPAALPKPTPEIQEAPVPAANPVEPKTEGSAPAPVAKPTEPAASGDAPAKPEPPAAPPAAPVDSAPE
jgi:lipoprotein-anchoring transpeptidase ErfK/SrfK